MTDYVDNKKWFKNAKFGMMIHWGLYSILGGEYNGKRTDFLAEWIMNTLHIPYREYEQLAKVFNPIYFDADEWCKLAKDAGMNYIVITSKHHEGFCLFKSDYDDYNVVDKTPFKRDIIKELAEACKRHGLKLGLYYSQELDWHEPNAGGFGYWSNGEPRKYTNYWDFPDNESKDFDDYFRKKALPQVKELLTNYGDIMLFWFDTPGIITKEQSTELFDLVKSLQPNCLVNTRIGNGLGDYRSMGDNELPKENFGDRLAETPATTNNSWGFKYFDNNWKSTEELYRQLTHVNGCGANYLLNVGPDYLGRIPTPSAEILRELGKKIKTESNS